MNKYSQFGGVESQTLAIKIPTHDPNNQPNGVPLPTRLEMEDLYLYVFLENPMYAQYTAFFFQK